MGNVSTVRIFGKMKRWLTLITVKVNALRRDSGIAFGMTGSNSGKLACSHWFGLLPALTSTPVRVNAPTPLHLAPNTHTARSSSREVRP